MRPRLKPVQPNGITQSGDREYVQYVDEAKLFNGRQFIPGDRWIDGILFPDHLGIGFAERLADLPQFVLQVQTISGKAVIAIRGTASIALPGDAPLLGDWIRAGRFDEIRLARKFDQDLGGCWVIRHQLRHTMIPAAGYNVGIDRIVGT